MRQYNFYTYILTTSSKKVLYTGVTNDLERRLYEHYFGNNLKDNFTTNTSAITLFGLKGTNTFNTLSKEKKK